MTLLLLDTSRSHVTVLCDAVQCSVQPSTGTAFKTKKGDASYENSLFMQTAENKMRDDMDQHVTNG
jgi:hypothetical protein